MKNKATSNPGLILLTGVIIIFVVRMGMMIHYDNLYAERTVTDTAYHRPEKPVLTHIDSLPYYQYKPIADSLQTLADNEKSRNTLYPGIRVGTGFMGFVETSRYWYGYYTDDRSHLVFDPFLYLPDYTLKEGYTAYFDNGKFYLKNGRKKRVVAAGYLPEQKMLLFPVTEKTYRIGAVLTAIVMGLLCLCFLYILIVLPTNVIVNISKGKVFTAINVRDLYRIAYLLLAVFLVKMSAPYLIAVLLGSAIPDEFSISFSRLWSDGWGSGLTGLVVWYIANAFSKGYRLQQENDLTI